MRNVWRPLSRNHHDTLGNLSKQGVRDTGDARAVKSYLIFGFLRCLVDKGRRIGGCQQVAVGHARTGFGNICTDENSKD